MLEEYIGYVGLLLGILWTIYFLMVRAKNEKRVNLKSYDYYLLIGYALLVIIDFLLGIMPAALFCLYFLLASFGLTHILAPMFGLENVAPVENQQKTF